MSVRGIPVELLDPDREEEFIVWLNLYVDDAGDRKRLLVDWTAMVGAVLSRDLVERARATENAS